MFHLVKAAPLWMFLISLCFFGASCASRQKAYNTTILQTAKSLSNLYKNSQRPWPEFNLLDHPILFVSNKEKIIKRMIKNELQDLDYKVWSHKIPPTTVGFDTLTIDDQKYLALHLDNEKEVASVPLMATAIHEGFHFFGQSEWNRQKQEEGRGNIYPIQAIPRYYRWEMKNHLLEYLKTKDINQLRHYSYWYFKWKSNFKEEYLNYTDRIEGTAQYYTNQMMSLYRSQETKKVVQPLEVFNSNKATNQPFRKMYSLGYESYVLGTLSGILLDQLAGAGWQKTVRLDPSPLELLARRYQPLHDEANHKEQNEFIMSSIFQMEKIDKDGKLDRIISNMANPNFAKVVVNSKGLNFSSFATDGIYRSFFSFKGIKEIQMIELASPHEIRGKNFKLQFHSGDYWVTTTSTPCGKDHSTLLTFPKDQLRYEKGILKMDSSVVKELPAILKSQEGTDWFCVNP